MTRIEDRVILGVDIGSTKIAPIVEDFDRGIDLALMGHAHLSEKLSPNYYPEDCFWTRWTQFQKIYPDWGCKIVELDELLAACGPNIDRACERAGVDQVDKVVAGFTNSIALKLEGNDKVIIILDEPSLKMGELTDEQKNILSRYGLDPENIKPASSLAKLLRIINDKDYVKWLGEQFFDQLNLTVDQLQINTMLGVMADPDLDKIPLADMYGFSTKRDLNQQQTEKMLARLVESAGIGAIEFIEIDSMGENRVAIKNDFVAEGQYLDLMTCFLQYEFPWIRQAAFVSTDSVIKMMWLKNYPKAVSKRVKDNSENLAAEWAYLTQRVGGNVYRHLFRLIGLIYDAEKLEGGKIYRAIDRVIFDQLEDHGDQNPFVFYPDKTGDSLGSLFYRNREDKLIRIDIDKFVENFPENPSFTQREIAKKIIYAMAQGVYLAVREKLEAVKGQDDNSPVVFYGGMAQNAGWSRLMKKCLGSCRPVWFLKMRSAAEAAAVVAAFEWGYNINAARLPEIYTFDIGNNYNDETYKRWLEMRKPVEVGQ